MKTNTWGCGAARFVAKDDVLQVKAGDALVATDAVLNSPVGLALDRQGHLYVCERGENRIRRVRLW